MDRDPAINRLIEAARAVADNPTDDAILGLLNAAYDCPVELDLANCTLRDAACRTRHESLPPGARIVPASRVRKLPKSEPDVVLWNEDKYQAHVITYADVVAIASFGPPA